MTQVFGTIMKKFAVLFIALVFSTMASAIPLRFEEGKHYEVIAKVASDKPNLTEYFSFYCPHCFRFESVANELEKSMPEGAKFVKSHVDFMRSASPAVQQALTRAMVAGDKMGMKHKVVDAIFKQIHVDRKPFTGEDDVHALISTLGGDSDKFKKLMSSFGIKGAANKMKKTQDDLTARNILTSVPLFIVNDKYKINAKELKSMDDYKELVAFLLTMK
jgi:thiol:disulfide interchange protein DsbA